MQKNPNIPQALALLAAGRDNLTTAEAAHILHRKPQTLRRWACYGDGLISPVSVGRRLGWPVIEIAELISKK